MGLCGSYRCGCAVTALTPSGATAFNGHTPDIAALGSGEPGDERTAVLDVGWANEVAGIRDAIDNNPGLAGEWVDVPLFTSNPPDNSSNTAVMYRLYGSYDADLVGDFRYRQLAGSYTQLTWNFTVNSAPTIQGTGAIMIVLNVGVLIPAAGAGTFAYAFGDGNYRTNAGTIYTGQWMTQLEPSGSGFGFGAFAMQVFGGYGTSQLGVNPSVNISIGDVAQGSVMYQDARQTSAPV